MNKKISDEKLDSMLSAYFKKKSPYTFRVKEHKKSRIPSIPMFRFSTVIVCVLFAFLIGICLDAAKYVVVAGNNFTLTVDAANGETNEVDNKFPTEFVNVEFNDFDKNVDDFEVAIDFDVHLRGDRVQAVTYTANYAHFLIPQLWNSTIRISGKEKYGSNLIGTTCTSYSIDYEDDVRYSDDDAFDVYDGTGDGSITLVCRLDPLDTRSKELLEKSYYSGKRMSSDEYTELYDAFFRNVYVDITVTYYDGSSETKQLLIDYDHAKSSFKSFDPVITATLVKPLNQGRLS